MRDYYARYKKAYSWLIKEEGWVKSLQGVRESQFALGNGFLGSRGILEEMPHNVKPGTYIAGVYDKIGSQVSELANLPNPFNFKISIDGERVGVETMDALEHRRILNMRHGVLVRNSTLQDSRRRRYDYQSLRFVCMNNKNIGVMQVVFTPLDEGVTAFVETAADTSVFNAGTVIEGKKKHFRAREVSHKKSQEYLAVETLEKLHTVIFRGAFYYETGGRRAVSRDTLLQLKLRKGQTVVFTKIFCVDVATGDDGVDEIKRMSEKTFKKALNSSFGQLIKLHVREWEKLWDMAEVTIWGDPEVEKNFRFNIYHMLICASSNNGNSSIGARALSGEGYHGHIFWDAEIFMLPFYLYTLPEVARNMLLYRYRRLDAARDIAKKSGYKGAMFPWESACRGYDETPELAKDLDGEIIKIHTGNEEHHITADVAYACYHYYNATHDEAFLRDCGYEILFETARFWASRVEYNRKKKKYEIKHVIGPDEFHTDVNNNAYTNMMAKWNLLTAYKLFCVLKKSNKQLLKKIMGATGMKSTEPTQWKNIASSILFSVTKEKIIEQFDGYFKKRQVRISNWDERSIPLPPKNITPRDYQKTQLVKQGDVIMLLYLLGDVFRMMTKKKNYDYYITRTLHKSSLSLSVYGLIAAEVGDRSRAYRYFSAALHTDISNTNNNTEEGIHAACIGGTWQLLINGFAGIRIQQEMLSIEPRLPRMWRKVLFSLKWRKNLLRLEVTNDEVRITVIPLNRTGKLAVNVFGITHELSANKLYTFKRKVKATATSAYYL
ncbi:MAG: glycosyl hydrolase family 65 protein [bacterium]